jgi:hypothetical protein
MKTLVALSCAVCALAVTACGGRQVRDPSYGSTNTTGAPSENYGNASSATIYSSSQHRKPASAAPAPAAAPDPGPSTASEETAAAQRRIEQQSTAGDTKAGTSATEPSLAQPSVHDNPGTSDQSKNADNTKINDRDRHGTVTSGDQGNKPSEVKITADIRKGLMASKNLSFTAKNAKVITVGTKVTLRGTVKSDAERAEIEGVAKSTAGVSEVDNQLEVKK